MALPLRASAAAAPNRLAPQRQRQGERAKGSAILRPGRTRYNSPPETPPRPAGYVRSHTVREKLSRSVMT